jgi:predicted nucleic acid-binding protein
MNVYLDTSVLLGAAGHPAEVFCQQVVTAVGTGILPGVISAEVLQELLHLAAWHQARSQGLTLVELASQVFPHPLPITGDTVARSLGLLRATPKLGIRVAIHAAAMAEAGIRDVIAADPEFGLISGIRRFAPADAVSHFRL